MALSSISLFTSHVISNIFPWYVRKLDVNLFPISGLKSSEMKCFVLEVLKLRYFGSIKKMG